MRLTTTQKSIAVTALVVGGVAVYFGLLGYKDTVQAAVATPAIKTRLYVATVQIAATRQNPTAKVYYDSAEGVFSVDYFENDAEDKPQLMQTHAGVNSVIDLFNNSPGMSEGARQTHLRIILNRAAEISGIANIKDWRGQKNGPSDLELLRTLLPKLQLPKLQREGY